MRTAEGNVRTPHRLTVGKVLIIGSVLAIAVAVSYFWVGGADSSRQDGKELANTPIGVASASVGESVDGAGIQSPRLNRSPAPVRADPPGASNVDAKQEQVSVVDPKLSLDLGAEWELDWDAKLKTASVAELQTYHDSLRDSIDQLTRPTLQAMVDAGMGMLVNADSTVPYKVQKSDLTEITYVWSSPGLGTVRVVLPRAGHEAVYELKHKLLVLGDAIAHHPDGG